MTLCTIAGELQSENFQDGRKSCLDYEYPLLHLSTFL